MSGSVTVGCVGYQLLAIKDETKIAPRYIDCFLAACGVFSALCINITWLFNNQGGDSKKGAGLAILATLGQCSSLASSVVYLDSDG